MLRSLILPCSFMNFASRRNTVAAIIVAGMIGLFPRSAAALVTGNLLTDPGFESNPLTPISNVLGPPYTTNTWGDEVATITGSVGPVIPSGGTKMLSMTDDGGVATQTVQMVDVSAYSASINAGTATGDLSAMFNVDPAVAAGQGGVYLQFLDASYNFLPPVNISSQPVFDNNPATWQSASVTNVPIPIGTKYLLAQVDFINATMNAPTGVNEPGYVDDANMTLTTATPEPASIGLLIGAAVIGLGRRRRGK